MRIVSGRHKGRIITPPRNLRARPTTDFAKENLFNVLQGLVDIERCDVLDLFAGTGSVSYEFASRGARSVTAVEINAVHYAFIRRTAADLGFVARGSGRSTAVGMAGVTGAAGASDGAAGVSGAVGATGAGSTAGASGGGFYPVKANVFNYLRACNRQFDIIFSDAPYDLPGSEEVIALVFERGLLRPSNSIPGVGTEAHRNFVVGDDGVRGSGVSECGVMGEGDVAHGNDVARGGNVTIEDGVANGSDAPSEGGLLIFEHSRGHDFSSHPNFLQTRSYGSVQFSFFGASQTVDALRK